MSDNNLPFLEEDLERQPLLPPHINATVGESTPHIGTSSTPEESIIPTAKGSKKSRYRWYIPLSAIIFIILLLIVESRSYIYKRIPTEDEIRDNFVRMSHVEVKKVKIDGWTKDNGKTINNDSGTALQISNSVEFYLNYDKMDLSHDTEQVEWTMENIVKHLCFDINKLEIFNENDILTRVHVKDHVPICVDVRNGSVSHMEFTLLAEPNVENILKVLKSIWHKRYDEINIWSQVDTTVSRRWSSFLSSKISLTNLKINLNDFINWDKIMDPMVENIQQILGNIEIQSLSMSDSFRGFHIEAKSNEIMLPKRPVDWIVLPSDVEIPKLDWEIKLPDCYGYYTIDLPNTKFSTRPLNFTRRMQPFLEGELSGSLPDELLTHVCSSDEQDTVTPLTLLVNKFLNESEKVTVYVKGSHSVNHNNSLISSHYLNEALSSLSYFAVSTMTTFNITSLIKEFDIEDMKLKWETGKFGESKLNIVGTISGYLDLSFYETASEKLSVNNIKGLLRLYHDNKHFLTIPMPAWINATSEIIHDHEMNNGDTMMEITFDVQNNDVIIEDKMELTKCFNEIFFLGETNVHFENKLDIVLESLLGEIVLLGLEGEGDTTVH
ncbi:Tag1p NDAI_0G05230 [Naumovozyma dairenensis CBS 421]|uniref:Uncharacterized protein n=1 Tax=Naumovozyma dairenensis (strain ATCC 10597 / BCRC 20456 / CBS 421 / NBRC 0211 / NRRL Y-12639) TaxID=1071378 RepID=J7S4K6_NAUDC|nr:hypothetical protein NDAI_0G05230 [Naumovozyma dairenensis CBS 421]CCK73506.1 hypothetical protein NDAI_0G05230 [Naumovozyma dairenensis CBS 421]